MEHNGEKNKKKLEKLRTTIKNLKIIADSNEELSTKTFCKNHLLKKFETKNTDALSHLRSDRSAIFGAGVSEHFLILDIKTMKKANR